MPKTKHQQKKENFTFQCLQNFIKTQPCLLIYSYLHLFFAIMTELSRAERLLKALQPKIFTIVPVTNSASFCFRLIVFYEPVTLKVPHLAPCSDLVGASCLIS